MNSDCVRTKPGKGRRQKYQFFEAKIFYTDGEASARTYTDRKKAERFAERQRKSPVVRMARVTEVG